MTLVELVEYLKDLERLNQLCLDLSLPDDEDVDNVALAYMKGALSLESEVVFFTLVETGDAVVYEKNGISHIQLFPLFYAAELIEEDLDLLGKGYSNYQIAKRLLEYRIKDA